jgi:hypothetical protein
VCKPQNPFLPLKITMSNTTTLRSLCVSRITPIAAAIAFTLSLNHADATIAKGQELITAKLVLVKAGATAPTITKATAADLIAAIGLAIEDTTDGTPVTDTSVADIAEGAVAVFNAKARGDRATVAPQIISTAALLGGLNSTDFADLVKRVYAVNGSDTKTNLNAAGKSKVVIAALSAPSVDLADALAIGKSVGTIVGSDADIQTLFKNTSTNLKKTIFPVGEKLEDFVDGLLTQTGKAGTAGEALIKTAATAVAATNPEAAGAFYGGLVKSAPGSYNDATEIGNLANQVLGTANKKLAKATGAILANVLSGLTDAEKLAFASDTARVGGTSKTLAADSLVVQGILRADAGTLDSGEVGTIVGKVVGATTTAKKGTLAGVLAVGTDGVVLQGIITKVGSGIASPADLATIGSAAINANGVADPDSAKAVAVALLGLGGNSTAQSLGEALVKKIKTSAAAGYAAQQLVATSGGNPITLAAAYMNKGTKFANDIAFRVATVAATGSTAATFAEGLANNTPKLVQSAAVGTSLAFPEFAGDITAKAIVHSGGSDKAALGKAATIATAVATIGDVETASLVAFSVGQKMSSTATVGSAKPIKLSLVTSMATNLAKAIQVKPGVNTANRMDELGELAAVIATTIIKGETISTKQLSLLTAAGSAIIKQLLKTQAPATNSAFVFSKADLTEARDIAGSFALAISQASTAGGVADPLLVAGGKLETALAKAAGKASATVLDAFTAVRNSVVTPAGVVGFELGADFDPETDTRDF